jgi:hypothetical protein
MVYRNGSGVPALEQLCMKTVATNLSRLREGCMGGVPDYIRIELFEAIRQRNPLLLHGQPLRALVSNAYFEELDFSNACNLGDADLLSIGPSLGKVRKLSLVCCHYISENAMACALRYCTSLTSLKLEMNSKITGDVCLCPDGCAGMVCREEKTGERCFEDAAARENNSIRPLERKLCEVFACSPVPCSPNRGRSQTGDSAGVGPDSTGSSACPLEQNGREDGASGQGEEADGSLVVEVQSGLSIHAFASLTNLSLAENKALCDEGVRHVVIHAVHLLELNLNKCEKLGEDVLSEIATTSLTKLSIGFLPNLSDRGQILSTHIP